jgi:septum site-determining protein MinC
MSEPHADPSSPSVAAQAGALRAPARPAAEFKGLSHPALRLVLNEADADALAAALDVLLGVDDDEAFEWQPVVVDASRVAEAEALALSWIVERLRDARLHPVAVAGAHVALRDEADRLSLGWLAPLPTTRRARPGVAGSDAKVTSDAGPVATAEAGAASAHAAAGAPGEATAEPGAEPPRPALVVERPVRSGQQVYARGGDLVVIGDVSPGAEVIADGNVHVYGTLGGRAIAGARGRRDAGIFTLDLRAELVAVCGIYRTFEDGPPAAQAGKPVRISLEADADTLSLRTL